MTFPDSHLDITRHNPGVKNSWCRLLFSDTGTELEKKMNRSIPTKE